MCCRVNVKTMVNVSQTSASLLAVGDTCVYALRGSGESSVRRTTMNACQIRARAGNA